MGGLHKYYYDRDPTISYSPSNGWYLGGVHPEYDNTTHGSILVGTPMEISFSFQGTRVMVYGTIAPATGSNIIPPVSYYKLDNTATATYTAPAVQDTLYGQQFYDSGDLTDGVHSVVINPLTTQNSTVWFDYYTYLPSTGNQTTSSPASSSTTTVVSHISSSATTSTQQSPSSSATSPPSKSSTTHIMPIIAGTLGSIAGLSLLALLALFLRWRRRKRSYLSLPERRRSPSELYDRGAPTVLSSVMGSSVHRPGWSVASTSHTVSPPQPSFINAPMPLEFDTVSQAPPAPSIVSDLPVSIAPAPSVSVSSMEPPDRHMSKDAGLRLEGGPLQRVDLPPRYQHYD